MSKLQIKTANKPVQQAHCAAVSSLLEAHFAIASGEPFQAREALQHALTFCKSEGHSCFDLLNQNIVSELLHWSYQHGIEPDYVRHTIQTMQLEPAPVTQPEPGKTLPIMIYSLGRFSIKVDKNLVIDNQSGRNKPLELLKVLIALGGRQVSQEKVTEILWPDAHGDCAVRNFNTTLHRLRKVLQISEALVLKDGLLTLNNRIVQVDLWETERTLGQLEQLLRLAHTDHEQVQTLSDRLLDLFHGDFLGNEPDRNWSLLVKERLRNRILKTLQQLGQYWQARQQSERAHEIYERGLALDPLQEIFYQRLIKLHIDIGHPGHAVAMYEKCRRMLATSLGVMPSSRTLALYRQIQPN